VIRVDTPTIFTGIVALVSGAVGGQIISWLRGRKTDAAQVTYSLTGAAADFAERLDNDNKELRQQLADLSERVSRLELRNSNLEHSNSALRSALLALTHWVRQVLLILTTEQRAEVGQPPDTDHLLNS
jgi:hypothetical protein